MIFILDKKEKVINTLKNNYSGNNGNPYFNDVLQQDLATGAESYSFSTFANGTIANDLVIGNYIAFKHKNSYKLFQITNVEIVHEESMEISVYSECAGLTLLNNVFRSRKMTSCTLRQFIDAVVENTDWTTGLIEEAVNSVDLDIETTSCYSALQQNISSFGVELEFRVELNRGKVSKKYIDTYKQRGRVTGKRFTYGRDIEKVVKTVNSEQLYTALIGEGKNGVTFRDITVDGIDKPLGQDFVADQESFQKYNRNGYHLMGVYSVDSESPEIILRETYKKLQEVKSPKISYEIPVVMLGELLGLKWDEVSIGDQIGILDAEFNPPLMLSARVSNLQISKSNPESSTCTLSNFIEVSSNITDEMRKIASKLEGYVDNKFPIGSNDIQEGAVNETHMDKQYMTQITADIVNTTTLNAKEIITEEITAVNGRFENIEADVVKANQIAADAIKANTITAGRVDAVEGNFSTLDAAVGTIGTLVNGNLTSDNIQAGGITGDRLNMDTVFVNDANIINVSASKINAGQVNTNKVTIQSDNGGIVIADNTQQFRDKNGKVRIQMGQDATGEFTFGVFDETGTGTLIDSTGVKEKALADGIIKDRMIGEGEIGGAKIDISSLITEVNKDTNTEAIKGSKVLLDTEGQRLDVAFSSLKNVATDAKSASSSNTTQIGIEQGRIDTLIANTTIEKEDGNITLKDAYSETAQTVSSLKTTVGEHETKWTENEKFVSTTKTTLEQLTDKISLKVESSYVEEVFENTIKSVDVQYYLSTSSSTLTGGSWSTSAPAWQKGKYIWTKTVTTYMSGLTQETTPVCISGVNGQDGVNGQNGADGKGVSSITEEYYLSTSKTTQSGGSWVTTPPTWSSGKYMWTRSKIVYTNPASTVYTAPVCDSSWEAVNEVEIGGRNLIMKTSSDFVTTPSISSFVYIMTATDIGALGLVPGDMVTFRIYLKPQAGTTDKIVARISQYYGDGTTYQNNLGNAFIGGQEGYSTVTTTIRSDIHSKGIFLSINNISRVDNPTVQYKEAKFERGNKATDWSPAPEDTEKKITTVSSRVSEMTQDIEGIKTRVSKTETTQTEMAGVLTSYEERIHSAEQKITSDAIVSTVRNSESYTNDLNSKANQSSLDTTNDNVNKLTTRVTESESSIKQLSDSISLKVEKKDIEDAINSANMSRADFISRNFLHTPLIVSDSTLPIYANSGIPNPPVGSVFGSYNQKDDTIKSGSVSSNGTSWAIIIGYEFYNNTTDEDKKLAIKNRIKQVADFMCSNVSVGRLNSMNFNFIDTNYKLNATSGQWEKGNYKEIYISTMWLQVKAMIYAYEILQDERYLNLGLDVLDSLFNAHFHINKKVKSGELPAFLEWASYEYLACDNLSSNKRFAPSIRQYANQMGYYIHQAIRDVIRVVGDNERTTPKGDKYKPSDILKGLKKYLKNAYETQNITAMPLGLPYGYYHMVDNGDGSYSYLPQNWDFINNTWGDSWFVGDVVTYTIYSFAASGLTDIAREYANNYYKLRVVTTESKWANRFSNSELLFYDRIDFNTGTHLEGDDSVSITYTALFYEILKEIGLNEYIDACCYTLAKHQVDDLSNKNIDGSYPWDVSKDNASLEFKSLGEIINSKFYKNLNITSFSSIDNKFAEIEVTTNSITERVSSTENEVSDINGSISSLQTRMSSAEEKITDEAIISTVQTTISNAIDSVNNSTDTKLENYATKASMELTATQLKLDFSSSGGYNIVKNGGFKNSSSGWSEGAYNPNGTSRSFSIWSDSNEWVLDGTYALCMRSTNNTSGEFRVDSQKFKVKRNTTYTLSYLVSAHRVTKIGHYIRGNEWDIIDSRGYCPATGGKNRDNWTRVVNTFNTGDNYQISINFIHFVTGSDAYSWITDVIINEGEVALPWTPHPSEIYEGSTVIDASGVTVKNGALRVQNNAGQTVLSGDSNGNLTLQNVLTVGGNNDGRIEVKNSSNNLVIGMNKAGIACTGINFYRSVSLSSGIYDGDKTTYMGISGNDGLLSYQQDLSGGYEHKTLKIKNGKLIAGGYSGSQGLAYDGVVIEGSSVTTGGTITAGTIHATSNGQGTNFKVGDDIWIGDINVANTMGLKGVANSSAAYIQFGAGAKIGHNGTGGAALDVIGNVWVEGNMNVTSGVLALGRSSNSSYVEFRDSTGNRRGYIGKGDPNSNIIYVASEADKTIVTVGHFCPSGNRMYWLGTNSPARQWKGLCAEGGTVGASDIRAKENIERLDGTIVTYDEVSEKLNEYQLSAFKSSTRAVEWDYYEFVKDRFKPVYYNYKLTEHINGESEEYVLNPEDEYNMLKNVGFIAQDYDLENDKVAQEFIFKNEDGTLSYNHMSYVTVGMIALQEAAKKIDALKEQNENLQTKNKELEDRLKILEDLILTN